MFLEHLDHVDHILQDALSIFDVVSAGYRRQLIIRPVLRPLAAVPELRTNFYPMYPRCFEVEPQALEAAMAYPQICNNGNAFQITNCTFKHCVQTERQIEIHGFHYAPFREHANLDQHRQGEPIHACMYPTVQIRIKGTLNAYRHAGRYLLWQGPRSRRRRPPRFTGECN